MSLKSERRFLVQMHRGRVMYIYFTQRRGHIHTHICIYVLGQVDFHLFLDNPISTFSLYPKMV